MDTEFHLPEEIGRLQTRYGLYGDPAIRVEYRPLGVTEGNLTVKLRYAL